MSPTFLEVTVGLIAAVLVFMLAVRVVPLIIDGLSRYFDKTLDIADGDERDSQDYEH